MWIAVAFLFSLVMFASYVALFRGVIGTEIHLRWRESYEITMASLAATRLFSAGGAGGIVLTYWALRKAGMPPKDTAARMVAFNVLLYAVYLLTLLINGILLRTGVFRRCAGRHDRGPGGDRGRVAPDPPADHARPGRSREAHLGRLPAALLGADHAPARDRARDARDRRARGDRLLREPSRGGLAVGGAIGFWAAR